MLEEDPALLEEEDWLPPLLPEGVLPVDDVALPELELELEPEELPPADQLSLLLLLLFPLVEPELEPDAELAATDVAVGLALLLLSVDDGFGTGVLLGALTIELLDGGTAAEVLGALTVDAVLVAFTDEVTGVAAADEDGEGTGATEPTAPPSPEGGC